MGDQAAVQTTSQTTHKNTARYVLETAANLVSGDRAAQNGDKLTNHQNIAELWSAYTGQVITAHDVAIMMVLLKVARTKAGRFNPDDYIDMAGYAGCAIECYAEDKRLPALNEIIKTTVATGDKPMPRPSKSWSADNWNLS